MALTMHPGRTRCRFPASTPAMTREWVSATPGTAAAMAWEPEFPRRANSILTRFLISRMNIGFGSGPGMSTRRVNSFAPVWRRRLFDADMPPEAIEDYLALQEMCHTPAKASEAFLAPIERFTTQFAQFGTPRNQDTIRRMQEAIAGFRKVRPTHEEAGVRAGFSKIDITPPLDSIEASWYRLLVPTRRSFHRRTRSALCAHPGRRRRQFPAGRSFRWTRSSIPSGSVRLLPLRILARSWGRLRTVFHHLYAYSFFSAD